MLQYRLQLVGNFRCDYATGADFCDAFVTGTDSSYLLAFLLTANHEAAERCFVAALDQAFKTNAVFKEWATPGLDARGLGPFGVHPSLDELRMNDGRRVACWDYFVLPQGANAAIRSWLRLPQPLQVQARTGYFAPAD